MTDPMELAATPSPNGSEVGYAILVHGPVDHARHRVLELAGEYDISSKAKLRAALDDPFLGPNGLLVIDLTRVTFIDAGCTEMLMSAASKRQVVVAGATGIVARVLDLVDPDQQLPRYRTRPSKATTNIDGFFDAQRPGPRPREESSGTPLQPN